MTARSFRLRLTAPSGQFFSKPYYQNKGIPQGGVLSPLLWLILVNRIPEEISRNLKRKLPEADLKEDLLIQLFADDISAVISASTEEEVVERAFICW